ncbi:hypothetical protein DPEC_G00212910 [Dallia pectoralis]|uniref:Uncharacterized protein n=1 Tax=Dallia pectoralis TaxID=75939 RepID=A0ACC2G6Q5_DALPE|nr:hypothetical protein DPEC_G00212910 [Dallia pectoralis]
MHVVFWLLKRKKPYYSRGKVSPSPNNTCTVTVKRRGGGMRTGCCLNNQNERGRGLTDERRQERVYPCLASQWDLCHTKGCLPVGLICVF